jgi:transcriptional regulator with XRE-family HTH domain
MPRPYPPHPARAVLVMRRLEVQRVAADLGYSYPWVSRVLNRRDPASPAFRRALAAYLGLAESELFDDDPPPEVAA